MTATLNVARYMRVRTGKTMAELAAETNMTANDICRLESGNTRVWIEKAEALAGHFGVTVDALLKNDLPTVMRTLSAPPETSRRSEEIFEKQHRHRMEVGFAGEQWDYKQELAYLRETDLTVAVNQNYADDETSHFDLLSFTRDGRPRYCEVKSTTRGAKADFCITVSELALARACVENGELYEIHRVFHALDPRKRCREIITGEQLLQDYDFVPFDFKAVKKVKS